MTTPSEKAFIEFVRVVDATMGVLSSKSMDSGQGAVALCKLLRDHGCLDNTQYISPELRAKVEAIIEDAESSELENKRKQIKTLYFYPDPMNTFCPWQELTIPNLADTPVAKHIETVKFCGEMTPSNTVRLAPVSLDPQDFRKLFDELIPVVSDQVDESIEPDYKPLHVTLIRSDVISERIGASETLRDEMIDWFKEQDGVTVNITSIAKTFSRDWAPGRQCFVVRLASPETNALIDAFNAKFDMDVKYPSFHITFAIEPRNLIPRL